MPNLAKDEVVYAHCGVHQHWWQKDVEEQVCRLNAQPNCDTVSEWPCVDWEGYRLQHATCISNSSFIRCSVTTHASQAQKRQLGTDRGNQLSPISLFYGLFVSFVCAAHLCMPSDTTLMHLQHVLLQVYRANEMCIKNTCAHALHFALRI